MYGSCLFLVTIYLIFELSTPFVNARWMLDKAGFKSHAVYKINGICMLVTFFMARLVPFQPIFLSMVWPHLSEFANLPPGLRFVIPTAWLLSMCLNIIWFRKMVIGAIKVFFPKPKKAEPAKKAD